MVSLINIFRFLCALYASDNTYFFSLFFSLVFDGELGPMMPRDASLSVVVDVTTLKMARKPVKLQKENPAGCVEESKQNKGN